MKTATTALICACMALGAASVPAKDEMARDGMMKKDMTLQECNDHIAMAGKDGMKKDHMAMAGKDGMKKDDMMMKKDTLCADMMKKEGAMMKKDGMASEPMKK